MPSCVLIVYVVSKPLATEIMTEQAIIIGVKYPILLTSPPATMLATTSAKMSGKNRILDSIAKTLCMAWK